MSVIKDVFVEIYIDERCERCDASANHLCLWERQGGFDLRCQSCGTTAREAGLRDVLEIVRQLRESADYIKKRGT